MAKIKVKEVWLNRAEGPKGQTGERIVHSLEAADEVLKKWAQTAPKPGGGYDKTDFKVTFDDGETYEGRYDLKQEDRKKKSLLGTHIQENLVFYGGLHRPSHLTAEQYDQFIENMSREGGPTQEDYIEFLRKYEL